MLTVLTQKPPFSGIRSISDIETFMDTAWQARARDRFGEA